MQIGCRGPASLWPMARTHLDRLVEYLTDAEAGTALAADLRRWMEGSRPFRAFAEEHRDKIRKKIRIARDDEARRDLRAELAVAHAVLADRRVELAYERAGATVGGPDFTISFRGHVAFNLEVTRWRGERATLARQIVAKLRQLPPSVANAVLVDVDASAALPELDDVMRRIRARAETRAERARLTRLGGVYVWSEAEDPARAALWLNDAARIRLPTTAARAVLAALEEAP